MSFLNDLKIKIGTWFGKIMVRVTPPKVKAAQIREAMDMMKPGMVVMRKYDCYADGLLIPGKFSHSSIAVEDSGLIHAVAEGVAVIDIIDFLKDCDAFCLMFPCIPFDEKALVDYAVSCLGQPYDFDFDITDKKQHAYFCHELTAKCLMAGGVQVLPVDYHIGIAHKMIWNSDSFLNNSNLKLVYTTLA